MSKTIIGDFHLPQGLLDALDSDAFPWYLNTYSSSTMFPFMCHVVISRGDGGVDPVPNSDTWPYVKEAFDRFCADAGIEYDEIIRCAFNLVLPPPIHEKSDLHVDDTVDHRVLVAHLFGDQHGDTIIYQKTYEPGGPTNVLIADETEQDLKELWRFSPEAGKAVCFDGAHFHAAGFPKLGERRIVCVINFTVKK